MPKETVLNTNRIAAVSNWYHSGIKIVWYENAWGISSERCQNTLCNLNQVGFKMSHVPNLTEEEISLEWNCNIYDI